MQARVLKLYAAHEEAGLAEAGGEEAGGEGEKSEGSSIAAAKAQRSVSAGFRLRYASPTPSLMRAVHSFSISSWALNCGTGEGATTLSSLLQAISSNGSSKNSNRKN